MKTVCLFLTFILGLFLDQVEAQWSSDPYTNLILADGPSTELYPEISVNPDDSSYVGWTEARDGSRVLVLQHLAPDGTEMWGDAGLMVSPTFGQHKWLLKSDSAGNALVAVCARINDQPVWTLFKIDVAGNQLWTTEGLSGFFGEGIEGIWETPSGEILVFWRSNESANTQVFRVQRLTPTGGSLYPAEGIVVTQKPETSPGHHAVVTMSNGGFIHAYSPFSHLVDGHLEIKAQRYSVDGQAVWPSFKTLDRDETLSNEPGFCMVSDGQDGVFVSWTRFSSPLTSVRVQHIHSDGTTAFPFGGTILPGDELHSQSLADISLSPDTKDLVFIYYNQMGVGQRSGIWGQRLSADGQFLWGEEGKEIFSYSSVDYSPLHMYSIGEETMCLARSRKDETLWSDYIVAFKIDGDGNRAWFPAMRQISAWTSGKDLLQVGHNSSGEAYAVWLDNRWTMMSIFGQNIHSDGTLGLKEIEEPPHRAHPPLHIYPNPFNPRTGIALEVGPPGRVVVEVFDLHGRLVKQIADFISPTGPVNLEWNGTDSNGQAVGSGEYMIRAIIGEEVHVQKATLIR